MSAPTVLRCLPVSGNPAALGLARATRVGKDAAGLPLTALRHALLRRSQRHRLPWVRFNRLAQRYIPYCRMLQPYPAQRFAASRPPLRQEPYAVIPQVRICAGGAGQPASLPRPLAPAHRSLQLGRIDLLPTAARGGETPLGDGYASELPQALRRIGSRCTPCGFHRRQQGKQHEHDYHCGKAGKTR